MRWLFSFCFSFTELQLGTVSKAFHITNLLTHKYLLSMITISNTYKVKWQLKFDNNYVWTECGKLFNFRTNRELKKTIKGSKIGYWIGSKFYKIEKLKEEIELIPKIICPF